MVTIIFALALYGLFTIAYQVTGLVIDAVALLKKTDRAMTTLLPVGDS